MSDDITQALALAQAIEKASLKGPCVPISIEQLAPVGSTLALSPELLDWYQAAAPANVHIPWHGNNLQLFNPLELVNWQIGYRWAVGEKTIHESWDENWIVIGDIGGDPIIAHVDQPATPISMSVHGVGFWKLQRVAPSLAVFLEVLAAWLGIVGDFAGDPSLDTGELRPEVIDALKHVLSGKISQDEATNWLDFIY